MSPERTDPKMPIVMKSIFTSTKSATNINTEEPNVPVSSERNSDLVSASSLVRTM